MDFARDGVDVAIRFGYGPDEGLYSFPLAFEWMTPVLTPDLAQGLKTPRDLIDAPLLFDDSVAFLRPRCDWPTWFKAVGIAFDPSHGTRFTQADHAIDAALAGAGVVLGRRSLVVKDLFEGRLVAPFRTALQTKAHFRFICREGAEHTPRIQAFRDWMISEIAKTASVTEALEIVPVEALAAQ